MSLIPQFKTELQYIPTVKACLKLSQVDCFCLRLKGSLELREGRTISGENRISRQNNKTPISLWFLDFWI